MSSRYFQTLLGRQAGVPLNTGAPSTNISYSGQDIRVVALAYGRSWPLGNLHSFSYSVHRDVRPVRGLGAASPRTHSRGFRSIAGTLVFAVFNKDAFYDMISLQPHDRNASGMLPNLPDQMPPFNLLIICESEVSRSSYSVAYTGKEKLPAGSQMAIYGIVLSDQGGTSTINDLQIEGVFNYQAIGMMPLTDQSDTPLVSGIYQILSNGAERAIAKRKKVEPEVAIPIAPLGTAPRTAERNPATTISGTQTQSISEIGAALPGTYESVFQKTSERTSTGGKETFANSMAQELAQAKQLKNNASAMTASDKITPAITATSPLLSQFSSESLSSMRDASFAKIGTQTGAKTVVNYGDYRVVALDQNVFFNQQAVASEIGQITGNSKATPENYAEIGRKTIIDAQGIRHDMSLYVIK